MINSQCLTLVYELMMFTRHTTNIAVRQYVVILNDIMSVIVTLLSEVKSEYWNL